MSDGANLGIDASRALDAILGDAGEPNEDERTTPAQTRERLEAAPLFDGPTPWENDDRDAGYGAVADSIGHAFLILIEEDASLLEPQFYPETYPDGSPMHEVLVGKQRDQSDVLWNAMKERWPQVDKWCGGASGFQVGFAFNAACYALERPTGGNPAIVTMRKKKS